MIVIYLLMAQQLFTLMQSGDNSTS